MLQDIAVPCRSKKSLDTIRRAHVQSHIDLEPITCNQGYVMRPGILVVLMLLACPLWTMAQSPAPPAVSPTPPGTSAQADGELQLVVALFRHGVRAPLPTFAARAHDYSGQSWPPHPGDWGAKHWGDLTTRGATLASYVGAYYARTSKRIWPDGFTAYLWSDMDPRNKDTANALAEGVQKASGVDVNVENRGAEPDPLFHPFKAKCGTPDAAALTNTVADMNQWRQWAVRQYGSTFGQLYSVLGCHSPPCVPRSGQLSLDTFNRNKKVPDTFSRLRAVDDLFA